MGFPLLKSRIVELSEIIQSNSLTLTKGSLINIEWSPGNNNDHVTIHFHMKSRDSSFIRSLSNLRAHTKKSKWWCISWCPPGLSAKMLGMKTWQDDPSSRWMTKVLDFSLCWGFIKIMTSLFYKLMPCNIPLKKSSIDLSKCITITTASPPHRHARSYSSTTTSDDSLFKNTSRRWMSVKILDHENKVLTVCQIQRRETVTREICRNQPFRATPRSS